MHHFLPTTLVIILFIAIGFIFYNQNNLDLNLPISVSTTIPDKPIFPYQIPKLEEADSYRIILVGDSMTASLGVNANDLRLALIEKYPEREFVTYNYSIPSSNILSIANRLTESGIYLEQSLPPILNQGYDLLIIESFAYNPLSEFSTEEGLKKHNQVLDNFIKKLVKNRPESPIVLLTMFRPDPDNFLKGSVDLTQEQRDQWVTERINYLKNHASYAEKNNLPIINIYQKSKDLDSETLRNYIENDNIHPSDEGRKFIAEEIAKFIFEEEIFPEQL